MKKPHVVHVVGSLHPGGVQKLLLGLFQSHALSDFKHSIICTTADGGKLEDQFTQLGVRYESCLFEPKVSFLPYKIQKIVQKLLFFTFYWRFQKSLSRLGPDIVHTHISEYPEFQARAIFKKEFSRKWVWTIHGLYELSKKELGKWKEAIALAGKSRFFVTMDSCGVENFFKKSGVFENAGIEKFIIYPGADLPDYQKRNSDLSPRLKLGIKAETTLFCSVGRLVSEKGLDILIKAAGQIIANRKDVHFLIVGDGGLRDQLEAQVAALNLVSFFTFTGFQDNPACFLKEADVFLIPSRSEGFPLSLIEALSADLPCIASNIGGIPEILDERCGILVPAEDVNVLAAAIKTMIDPMVREKYKGEGRTIAKKFSFEECGKKFRNLYLKILKAADE